MRNRMTSILGPRTIKIRSRTENGVKGVSVNLSDFLTKLAPDWFEYTDFEYPFNFSQERRVPELEPFKMSHL